MGAQETGGTALAAPRGPRRLSNPAGPAPEGAKPAPGAFTPAQVAAIRARASALGYHTPTALARAAGVSHPTVMRWYSGERAPSARAQQALAAALELEWPTDFLVPPAGYALPAPAPGAPADAPAGQPVGGNVYGTTAQVYGALGFLVRPVYRAGTRLDLARVGREAYPLPHYERPVPPEQARAIGADGWALLHSGAQMVARRPEPAVDGDVWWIVPVARRAPRPGDLVAARVEPPEWAAGEAAGVVLRSYDLDPETGEPVLYEDPAPGIRVPVRWPWTVLGVALVAETLRPARHDA